MKKQAIIGLTGVIALVVLFLGINFLKGAKLFTTQSTYYINFQHAKGLSRNSAVFADGYKVGIVSDIIYDWDTPGRVLVEISTDPALRIPKGSTARLDEAVLGGCTLNMMLANNMREAYHQGDTIMGDNSQGFMAKAADMVPQVEQVVARVDTLVAALNRLVGDPNLPLVLDNAGKMMNNLNQASAQLNSLLRNDMPRLTATYTAVGENVKTLTGNLNQLDFQQTLDSINGTISNVNQMITQIQSAEGTLGLLMKDPALYQNLNHTVQSADSLVTDLKAHPKRYVHFSVFGKKDK